MGHPRVSYQWAAGFRIIISNPLTLIPSSPHLPPRIMLSRLHFALSIGLHLTPSSSPERLIQRLPQELRGQKASDDGVPGPGGVCDLVLRDRRHGDREDTDPVQEHHWVRALGHHHPDGGEVRSGHHGTTGSELWATTILMGERSGQVTTGPQAQSTGPPPS